MTRSLVRRRPATAPRRGVTIVELVVAILVLTVGLLSLASTSTYVVRQMRGGSLQTVAAQLAQSRFDSLASLSCVELTKTESSRHTATARGVAEVWRVTDGNDIKNAIDSISFAGRSKPLVYQSVLTCRD